MVSVGGLQIIVDGVGGRTAADEALVGQLAWNVLHNCGKYAMLCSSRENNASPLVTIAAKSATRFEKSQEVEDLILTISDNGQGFYNPDGSENTHLMTSCFDPGVKGDDGGAGKGYGMFIARQCARALGGDLTVSNRKDGVKGAVFEARIPTTSKPATGVTEESGSGATIHPV
jgi:K+-sensing histidine kinase KdpD